MAEQRAHWGSRMGFILAAAGSAVGLGNIWRFSYLTGENGGGLFVVVYLACIALIGLPIMMAEILIGREAQQSPVGAYRALSRPGSPWMGLGFLSVVAAFVILSFYSVVAGWSMHYCVMSVFDSFGGKTAEEIGTQFDDVISSPSIAIGWHIAFMGLTMAIVAGGIRAGIERWSKILLPALFFLLLALVCYAATQDGFGEGFRFVFGFHAKDFRASSVLDAMGQAFFSLSLGMGALITYGSYLRKNDDIVSTSIIVGVLDTLVALLAGLVIFPILFTAGLDPNQGAGVAFVSLPIAFSNMPGGAILAPIFFLLLTFAALTSSISLLEVAAAYFIDDRKWTRKKATLVTGTGILLLGIPSALSFGTAMFSSSMQRMTEPLFGEGEGKSWFDLLDYLQGNWLLPIGGLGIAMFAAWRVTSLRRHQGFTAGSKLASLYWGWLFLLRFIVPIAVVAVFLHAIGVIPLDN